MHRKPLKNLGSHLSVSTKPLSAHGISGIHLPGLLLPDRGVFQFDWKDTEPKHHMEQRNLRYFLHTMNPAN